ncbi:molybdopterin molybdotransferase MoeA [Christiangramia portivictoriae]|uniref:molybdopterin molybdotransferase MoeA n=1 Tax=Christiangramia portivictoriae TaxID=326069 RepID=UPI0004068CE8|nr:molybdopterin molybdotransferase MoeA [Christiangramia portivictoriae]
MVEIKQALQIIRSQDVPLDSEVVSLKDSLGRVLAEDLRAGFDLPGFDNSAMDGYALGGLQQEYKLVGEVAAGDLKEIIPKIGEAVRIFTGAKVPQGTSAVIMQEKTEVKNDLLFLDQLPVEGQCIRKKGEELRSGELVFNSSYKITAAGIGMIGSLGLDKVKVFKKPVIRLITTGNELVAPGGSLQGGQIYESNSGAIVAALNSKGFTSAGNEQIKDDFEQIKTGIAEALQNAGVLILSGGISVGNYDFVKQALEENGVDELFYKVKQKPGKPLFFGRKENKFIFALPGNPASSLSCFYIYVLPLLQKLSGLAGNGLLELHLPAASDFQNRGDRPVFLKANIEDNTVRILNAQGSSMIGSMAKGNALAFVEAFEKIEKGSLIKTFLIS